MEIKPLKDWYILIEDLFLERGLAIILGASDTGKSTLAKFLTKELCKKGLKVGFVDADIGQSFLGPPTTIGLSLFKSDPDWEILLSTPEIFFVGSVTPEGNLPVHLNGVKRMVDKAKSYGVDLILVDTTGYVTGDGGRELKRRKIDLILPRFIVALQRFDEIEHILTPYKDNPLYKIYLLPLSDQVRARSMEERRIYRMNRFNEYFKYSTIHELAINQVKVEGEVIDPNGESIPLDLALTIKGILIGLKNGNDNTLALGVIRHYFEDKRLLRIFTPLGDIQRVKTVQLSSQKIIPLFEGDII